MTFHPYNGNDSLDVHDALYAEGIHAGNDTVKMNEGNWKEVLIGCTSALVYLQSKGILHNDIKADNILIERRHDCYVESGKVYRLSPDKQKYYAKHHPQVAPEVRRGVCKQSFASDIYSFGRVLQKVNIIALKIPYLYNLSDQCLKDNHSIRPTATELHTSLSNLLT